MALVSIGEAAAMLGVAVVTLRRWHREGKLLPACRTIGRHRRYELEQPERLTKPTSAQEKITVAYARVSSHDQKESRLSHVHARAKIRDYLVAPCQVATPAALR